ncbi:hypothetical protein AADZ90_018255 [Aestuariibius sp. 2305UL40-4]|uniref:hypothetical protein n=1 Tax=Aestuariibius violaceus TaxID=3234132 RepID=UPI00345E4344
MRRRRIDWQQADTDQRKTLYPAIKAVCSERRWTLEAFCSEVLPDKVGLGYESHLRDGTLSKDRAAFIHAWIGEHHPDLGVRHAPDLYTDSQITSWTELLEEHGVFGTFTIQRYEAGMGLVRRSDRAPLAKKRIALGEEFVFHLESGFAGQAIALQELDGTWYPMPLNNADIPWVADLTAGHQFLPSHPITGAPEPLREDDHTGRHGFALLIASDGHSDELENLTALFSAVHALPQDRLDDLAAWWTGLTGPKALYRLNVVFVARAD